MFACLYLPPPPAASALERRYKDADALVELAREFSPRVEVYAADLVMIDVSGLGRLFGDGQAMGHRLRHAAASRGLPVHVAIAATKTSAMLLARARAGLTMVPPGREAAMLASLPLAALDGLDSQTGIRDQGSGKPAPWPQTPLVPDIRGPWPLTPNPSPQSPVLSPVQTLRRWGLRTLGDLAALPPAALSERLGQQGLRWQRLARGEDIRPFAPDVPEERFEESFDLEWPVEGIEPLSFVLSRLFDGLCERLERSDRAAVVLHVAFRLVTRETSLRSLQLPAPMRDPRVLRTLVLLDLESHPVVAGIDQVRIAAETAPGRVTQFSLLARGQPFPEQLATLLARLRALMGEGRAGMAALVNSHRPGAFEMRAFAGPSTVHRALSTEHRVPLACPADVAREPPPGDEPRRRLTVPDRLVGHPTDLPPPSPRAGRRPAGVSRGPGDCGSPWLALATPAAQAAHCDAPSTEHRVPQLSPQSSVLSPATVLRRFRFPISARVMVQENHPVRVTTDRRSLEGGRIEARAGPWRTSGEWWQVSDARLQFRLDGKPGQVGWNRDEWDVALSDGGLYRIYRDRDRNRWFVDGIID